MRTFFHGWRRKAGCVLLTTSIGLTAVWARGHIDPKSISFQIGERKHSLTTNTGRLVWASWDKVEGLSLLEEHRGSLPNDRERVIYFQNLVLPLTLLSAYLLLVPSRNRQSKSPPHS